MRKYKQHEDKFRALWFFPLHFRVQRMIIKVTLKVNWAPATKLYILEKLNIFTKNINYNISILSFDIAAKG